MAPTRERSFYADLTRISGRSHASLSSSLTIRGLLPGTGHAGAKRWLVDAFGFEVTGDRTYRAVDPEGHLWTFAQHVRDVIRAEAQAALGQPISANNWA